MFINAELQRVEQIRTINHLPPIVKKGITATDRNINFGTLDIETFVDEDAIPKV
jgi:hypothetical protein